VTIQIDPTARVSTLADLEDSVRGTGVTIGAHVIVDSFVKIKPVGGLGDVVIGDHSVINAGCMLYSGNGIRIGRFVAVAANCVFAPVNHDFRRRNALIREQGFLPGKGGIVVEDDVWIGAGCTILDGALLRRGCVIGAMSLVRGEVPEYSVQAGNPLRLLGWRR